MYRVTHGQLFSTPALRRHHVHHLLLRVSSYPIASYVGVNDGGYLKYKWSSTIIQPQISSFRWYCADAGKDPFEKRTLDPPIDDGRKVRYYFQRFKFLLKTFTFGLKDLVSDGRIAWKTRRKWIECNRDYNQMNRAEIIHMFHTIDDWRKTMPTVIVAMLPVIGYFIPVIAFIFPKQLLSQQFWTAKQKQRFMEEDHQKRCQYYNSLVKETGKFEEFNKLMLNISSGIHPTNTELQELKYAFCNDGNLSLHQLPLPHLTLLCKCWSIKTGLIIPRWMLYRGLERKISRMHVDDLMVLKEGVESLSETSITQAVHFRGLDNSINLKLKQLWLQEWVDMSSQQSNGASTSFLAHSAVFKGINFGNHHSENV